MITNTHSVGVVRDAVIEWLVRKGFEFDWSLPVVAETWDGSLNDINGFHVTKAHAFAALDSAHGGPVAEGGVGGGPGRIATQFKGGIGTASRRLPADRGGYTIGVLVQCNYGSRARLSIAGVPVGQEIPDLMPCYDSLPGTPLAGRRCLDADKGATTLPTATPPPLLPHQLQRIPKRAAPGARRLAGTGDHHPRGTSAAVS